MTLEFLVVSGIVLFGALGVVGAVWMKVYQPDWLDQCQHYGNNTKEHCKAAFDKAKSVARSFIGR
jgi:hypothetical protein